MEMDRGVQQPVGAGSFDLQIDAEIGAEKQVGLSGFHRNADRRPSAVQVPGVFEHVVLGHHPAGTHAAFFALDGQNPVHQHQRLVRQTDPCGVGIQRGEFGAEHRFGGADGEFHAHVSWESGGRNFIGGKSP